MTSLALACIATLLYVAALALVLKWLETRALELDPRDEAGLSDDEIAELRILERGGE